MHEQLRAFVKSAVEAFALTGPVYEFGFCPTGSDGKVPLRDCFPDVGYVGCDLCDEGDVDQLERFGRLPFSDGVAGTVVCMDLLNHVVDPLKTVRELMRLLAPGGAMLVVAALDGPSWDHRRGVSQFQPGEIRRLLFGMEVPVLGWQGDPEAPHTAYAACFKPPLATAVLAGARRFLQVFPARLDRLALGHVRPLRPWDWLRMCWKRGLRQRDPNCQIQFVIDLPRGTTLEETSAGYSAGAAGSRLDLTDGG